MTDSPHRMMRPNEFFPFLGEGRSNGYAKVKAGLLPPPVKIGPQASAWPQREAISINRARVAGKSDDQIRELVRELVAARKREALVV